MSSTNRGYERHKVDFYVTPPSAIKIFIKHWRRDLVGKFHDDVLSVGLTPNKAKWLDPCAGGDAKHGMSYPDVIRKEFGAEVGTIDCRMDSLAERKEDYLTAKIEPQYYEVIITNPPFYAAQQIIEKALQDVKDNGYVVMLVRLNFFGSNQRFPFWEKFMPVWTYVHHRRFSFTDDGKTDSIEYAHMVWQKGYYPEFTMLKVI